jgi:predicted permease
MHDIQMFPPRGQLGIAIAIPCLLFTYIHKDLNNKIRPGLILLFSLPSISLLLVPVNHPLCHARES